LYTNELANKFTHTGDVIALEGGSTTLEIARLLDNKPLTGIWLLKHLNKRKKPDSLNGRCSFNS
jgi:DeoR/GlpR family transcriptional regulator of sugar metabolism